MLFTGVWALVKGWLDEETREKIQIVGGGYKKKLLQYVDEDQLIDFLGGTNKAKLVDDQGPWNDYEVLDGHTKGDIVGVRRKADGPNGKLFTPTDFEKLNNHMIPYTPPEGLENPDEEEKFQDCIEPKKGEEEKKQ